MDPFIGAIIQFGGNFAPRGWALCDGQLLSINAYSALFSVLGTTYGGDGRSTFGLPDLRGRAAIHPGNGPGLSSYSLGERGGSEKNTLTTSQLPSHTHNLVGYRGTADKNNPDGNALSGPSAGFIYQSGVTPNKNMAAGSIGHTGAGQAVNNIEPYLCVNFIIALQGTYPSRN